MLQMQDLTKSYGDVKALDGCTFGVGPGQMLGFLGPNGSGKTTTMRAIFGLIKLDRGSVTLDGKPITAQDRLAFGYMPEQRGLYPKMKAADQLAYLGALHGMESAEARRAGMGLLDDLGLSDRADDPVEELSFGNQQRVQLAAALVHDPSVLVLDEPFPEEASERQKRKGKRKPDQRLVWEFWNGERWVDLKPRDGTENLTRSGTIEFRGPGGLEPAVVPRDAYRAHAFAPRELVRHARA